MASSIMKFLEEDEDESMHSGADVEAFTAALNRDIEGDNTSTSQLPTNSDAGGGLSQAANHTPSQLFQQWKSSNREGNTSFSSEQEGKAHIQEQQNRHGSGSESQNPPNDTSHETSRAPVELSRPHDDLSLQQADQHSAHMSSQTMNMQNTDMNPCPRQEPNLTRNQDSESQLERMHRMGNQQTMTTGQATAATNKPRQVPFGLLLPVIEPQLDKDRAQQLHGLYARLRTNTINKEEFVRHMRSLVGDHMLKIAVFKLQQGQQSDSHGVRASHMSSNLTAIKQDREQPFPLQGLGKHQQHHMHFPQSPFSTYGNSGGNFHPGSNANMNTPSQSFKQQNHNLQMRQGPLHNHPSMGASQAINAMSLSERQNMFSDMKRMQAGSLAHFSNNSALQQSSSQWQPSMHKEQNPMSSMAYVKVEPVDQINDQQHISQLSTLHGPSSFSTGQPEPGSALTGSSSKDETFETLKTPGFSASRSEPMSIPAQLEREPMSITAQLERERQNASAGNSSLTSGSNVKTPPKKPTVGQKKPLEAPASALSKKQKVSGAFSDQSIEQLNDVTAVSGVNLREEEEQLFSGSKEDSRVSEASRKVVQEEEERLFLQKIPLQKKLAEIMAKCGVKNRSNDVERCLSLCVEERMRGLISNLIRLSKQRVDIEKPRHRTIVTSDVRQQIMAMNQKAREEWEKMQADAEKLQRADEPEGSGDGDDGRGKLSKVNKEEDDKMRTTAANVAARAAVGGDDMLSKWTLMIEQARQKKEGVTDVASPSQPSIDVGPKPVSTSERNSKDNPDTEKTSGAVNATPGPVRKVLKNQQAAIARTISVKDVISVLAREVQMSRSTLIYRLYEKLQPPPPASE